MTIDEFLKAVSALDRVWEMDKGGMIRDVQTGLCPICTLARARGIDYPDDQTVARMDEMQRELIETQKTRALHNGNWDYAAKRLGLARVDATHLASTADNRYFPDRPKTLRRELERVTGFAP